MSQAAPAKRGVLLVNLGSPDSTSVKDVRKYLHQFLMDGRVIDAPYPIRKMIVGLFILPFRPKESAHAYQQIWWDEGSPLIVLSRRLYQQVAEQLTMPVSLGMRYGNPSIESAIRELIAVSPELEEIYLFPLYPHYAMSTVETVEVEVRRVMKKLKALQRLVIQPPFYDDPVYIDALVDSAAPHLEADYDYLLFSYHGIPERHCKKTDPTGNHCLQVENCCQVASPAHARCYRHQVFRTTEEFVARLSIPEKKYSVAFQSRLGVDAWLTPPTDQEIVRLAESGIKRLLVICPAFVSDCLETLEEIGMRGKESFLEAGGESFEMIPCMNVNPAWISAVVNWCGSGVSEAESVAS